MKTKKVLKKLDKVEAVLSTIIDQYETKGEPSLGAALASAKQSVIRAKGAIDHHQAGSKTVRKPPVKAAAVSPSATGPRGRRRVGVAAAGQ